MNKHQLVEAIFDLAVQAGKSIDGHQMRASVAALYSLGVALQNDRAVTLYDAIYAFEEGLRRIEEDRIMRSVSAYWSDPTIKVYASTPANLTDDAYDLRQGGNGDQQG